MTSAQNEQTPIKSLLEANSFKVFLVSRYHRSWYIMCRMSHYFTPFFLTRQAVGILPLLPRPALGSGLVPPGARGQAGQGIRVESLGRSRQELFSLEWRRRGTRRLGDGAQQQDTARYFFTYY